MHRTVSIRFTLVRIVQASALNYVQVPGVRYFKGLRPAIARNAVERNRRPGVAIPSFGVRRADIPWFKVALQCRPRRGSRRVGHGLENDFQRKKRGVIGLGRDRATHDECRNIPHSTIGQTKHWPSPSIDYRIVRERNFDQFFRCQYHMAN